MKMIVTQATSEEVGLETKEGILDLRLLALINW